jgi:uncharacterized protein YcnI
MCNRRFASRRHKLLTGAALLALGLAVPASAHITFENKEVVAGTTAKFVLRVSHGCAGAPTTRVRLQLPEALRGAKPQPKPGWELAITQRPTGVQAAGGHGDAVGEEAAEIAWSGRLEDAHYDEFAFRAVIAPQTPAGRLYIPVVQECAGGAVERWIERPPAGGSADQLQFPAPAVRIVPQS